MPAFSAPTTTRIPLGDTRVQHLHTPLCIGTPALGYPRETVRRFGLEPEADVSRSSCQIRDVTS